MKRPITSKQFQFLFGFAVKVDEQQKDILSVSAEYIPESTDKPFIGKLINADGTDKKFCLKCTLGLDVKHTDVLILSQFLRSDGCMLPQRITGLCRVQQKRIGTLVTMAQKAGKKYFYLI